MVQCGSAFTAAGGTNDGGSTDAGSDGPNWCATQAAQAKFILCSDFDLDDTAVAQNFGAGVAAVPAGSDSGTMQFETTAYQSPPRGAASHANAFGDAEGPAGMVLVGGLWDPSVSLPTSVTCELQWYPVELSTSAGDGAEVASIFAFSGPKANGVEQIELSLYVEAGGKLHTFERYPGSALMDTTHDFINAKATTNMWHSVTIALSAIGQMQAAYAVTVDGEQVTNPFKVPVPLQGFANFAVGANDNNNRPGVASTGWTFDYDNVICR